MIIQGASSELCLYWYLVSPIDSQETLNGAIIVLFNCQYKYECVFFPDLATNMALILNCL